MGEGRERVCMDFSLIPPALPFTKVFCCFDFSKASAILFLLFPLRRNTYQLTDSKSQPCRLGMAMRKYLYTSLKIIILIVSARNQGTLESQGFR